MFSRFSTYALFACLSAVSTLVAQDGGFSAPSGPTNSNSLSLDGSGGGDRGGFVVSSNYKIKPLDEVTIRLYVADDLQFASQVRVGGDGKISLPYLAPISVEDMTIDEIREALFEPYNKDYYVNPQIDVKVVSYASRVVTVIGKVNSQRKVPFPSEEPLYLIEAIAAAGGWSSDRMARKDNVHIYRKDANGNTTQIVVDATNLTARDYPLQDGDLVEVKERLW
ncbi:MAG: polysaccharide biosynthesis/export family protein [Verrucomicrobiota bacterium JB022]|nr:polysaccharide biosynthesis/export family protein [Verrucomicrobiota bacterium JB022]